MSIDLNKYRKSTTTSTGIDLSSYRRSPNAPTQPAPTPEPSPFVQPSRSLLPKTSSNVSDAKNLLGGLVAGISAPGRTIQNALGAGVDAIFGTKGFGRTSREAFSQSTGVDLASPHAKVGEVAGEVGTAIIPGTLATKATRGLSLLSRTGIVGGTEGATQSLIEGEVNTNSAIATGLGVLGPVADNVIGFASRLSPQGYRSQITTELDEFLKSKKSLTTQTKLLEEQKRVPVRDILSDPTVYRGLKVEKGGIVPDQAIDVLDSRIDQLMTAKRSIIEQVDDKVLPVSRDEIRDRAISSIKGTVSPADETTLIREINAQVDALPEKMPLRQLDDFRATFRKSARDAKGLQKSGNHYTALENATRNTIFDKTDDLPFDTDGEFARLNDYVKQQIEVRQFLDKTLRGQRVKGGRLGTYTGRIIGALAGASQGPLGAIAGSEIGNTVADILMNNRFGNSMKMRLIKEMVDDPAILRQIDDLLQNVKAYNPLDRPALPPGAIQLGPESAPSRVRAVSAPRGDSIIPPGQSTAVPTYRGAAPDDLFEPKQRSLMDAIKDEGGYIRNPLAPAGTGPSQQVRQNVSSVDYNKLSPAGVDVIKKFLAHVDGSQPLKGEELKEVQSLALDIANRAKLNSRGGSNRAIADELADRYQSYITN